MQRKYILAVDILSTSPLHIGDVVKGTYDPATNRIHRYASGPGVGCSLTRVREHSPHAASDDAEGRPQSLVIPILTATKLRSALRRACADMIFSKWIERGATGVDADMVNAMTSGSHTTSPDAGVRTPMVDVVTGNEPFWNLWGGSSMFLEGSTVVADGLPLIDATLGALMSPALVDPAPGVRGINDLTQALPILRTDSVASGTVAQLESLVGLDALVKAYDARAVQRADAAASKKAAKEAAKAGSKDAGELGKKTDLRALNAIEVARAGLHYGLRVSVRSPMPSHLGLLLLAMQEVLRNGQIGGGGARGLGQFVGVQSRLYEVDPASGRMQSLCSLYGDRAGGYAMAQHAVVDEAVAAAQDYLSEVDVGLHWAIVHADVKRIEQAFTSAAV